MRLKDGRVDAQGSVEDLMAVGALGEVAELTETATGDHPSGSQIVKASDSVKTATATQTRTSSERDQKKDAPRKLVEDEHRDEGRVKYKIIKAYLQAA